MNDISALNCTELDNYPEYLKKWDKTLLALAEPFDPDEVKFIPQIIDFKKETAQAVAYTDSRVYTERLNTVIGLGFWKSEIKDFIITEYNKIIKAKLDWKTKEETSPERNVQGFKVGLIATVSIWMGPVLGWVGQDSTGGKETDDENWTTTAEAQAYKRAISKWGPGQYFYSFGVRSYPFKNGWLTPPILPESAFPTKYCSDCQEVIKNITGDVGDKKVTKTSWDIYKQTKNLYGRPLCIKCHRLAKKQKEDPLVSKRLS
jgi:hypothetical protein